MSKATGNEELPFVLVAQLYHDVTAKGGRRLTKVDRHIEHTTTNDTHQLGLRIGTPLVVKTTKNPEARLRLIVLNEVYRTYMVYKFLLLPSLKKIASRIVKDAWLNNIHSFDIGFLEYHRFDIAYFPDAKLRKKIVFLASFHKKSYLCTVIELGKHIEILLLDNDCVIVPDFGGFVAHRVTAYYDQSDHNFLPPKRMLGFNPQLRINDSLLVQSYVSAHDISYPEALRRVEDEVAELKNVLENEGTYTLEDIGTLTVNTEGKYQFEPCEAGILTPDYYGLGGCEFYRLDDLSNLTTQTAVPSAPEEDTDQVPAMLDFIDDDDNGGDRAIQIKLSWIRNTVAIAAAIVAFFIMATPIANSNLGTSSMSQLQSQFLHRLIPQDTNVVPATPVADTLKNQTAAVPTAAKDSVAVKHQEEPVAATTPRPYCIVLASQVKKSNAEDFVARLKKQGYDEAEVYIHNDVVRVVYGAYETEGEAYLQLNKMNDNENFYDAWVYKKVES